MNKKVIANVALFFLLINYLVIILNLKSYFKVLSNCFDREISLSVILYVIISFIIALIFILLILMIIQMAKLSKMTKKYEKFMLGKNAKNLEKDIFGLYEDNRFIKTSLEKNEKDIFSTVFDCFFV